MTPSTTPPRVCALVCPSCRDHRDDRCVRHGDLQRKQPLRLFGSTSTRPRADRGSDLTLGSVGWIDEIRCHGRWPGDRTTEHLLEHRARHPKLATDTDDLQSRSALRVEELLRQLVRAGLADPQHSSRFTHRQEVGRRHDGGLWNELHALQRASRGRPRAIFLTPSDLPGIMRWVDQARRPHSSHDMWVSLGPVGCLVGGSIVGGS
jgi:hypothetical protein